MTKNQTSKNHL